MTFLRSWLLSVTACAVLISIAQQLANDGAMKKMCIRDRYGSYLQEGQVIYVTGTLSVRDEKAPQLMCDFARPLNENFAMPPAASARAETQPQQRTGQTLYLRLPSVDGPEMAILRKIRCV